MKLYDVGEIVAERKLNLLNSDGPPLEVLALLNKPNQLPDHCDYYCPYQIKGVGDERARYSCGIDTFQALQLAIRTIGVELEVLNKDLGGKLAWDGDEKGWLGFTDSPGS
jgi:hypothetical protein